MILKVAEMSQLLQTHGGVDVGQVEFAAEHVNIHAVETGSGHALQAVLFGQTRFVVVIADQAATLDGGQVLIGLKTKADQVADGADAAAVP